MPLRRRPLVRQPRSPLDLGNFASASAAFRAIPTRRIRLGPRCCLVGNSSKFACHPSPRAENAGHQFRHIEVNAQCGPMQSKAVDLNCFETASVTSTMDPLPLLQKVTLSRLIFACPRPAMCTCASSSSKAGDGGWSSMSYPLTPICLQILNGSKIATPVRATSAVLRVTNINPCTLAVAASNPSMSGKGSGTLKSAQASAIGSSIGSTLSPSRVRICANQRSKAAACWASRRRFSSMPRRISARTRTLVPISLDRRLRHPLCDVRIRPFELADFGYDVRIEQEFQRSTSRHFFWRGWSNTPAKASSARSEPKISKAVLT